MTTDPDRSQDAWRLCALCHHSYPLHRNGTSACTGLGCHAGPDGGPCPGFVAEASPVPEPVTPWPYAGAHNL